MLDALHMVTTDSTNPYANLALEEALLKVENQLDEVTAAIENSKK